MKPFKPTINYTNYTGKYINKEFNTFTELKKHIFGHLRYSEDGLVRVVRYKRGFGGDSGEWCETYQMVDNKLKIIKSSWA